MRAFRVLLVMLLAGMAGLAPAGAARVKDIASLHSARDNQLIGYGLVVGLQGTGDSMRSAPFTEQSMRSMLNNLGIATETGATRAKNVAAVIVTANLPPFVRSGSRIDVTVSSLGDASSLAGGSLVMTPLRGADGDIYAAAQGPLIISGFNAQGVAEQVTQGVPTSGRIPNGAIVEREIPARFEDERNLDLMLRNPDFSTAVAMTDAINAYATRRFGMKVAREVDSRTIALTKPKKASAARFIAEIENIRVTPDAPARVVIDERTGTIVIGQDVKISQVAVSHGTLTVTVTETPEIVQPNPFSDGETAVQPSTLVTANQPDSVVAIVDGVSLRAIASGLNQLGVKPTDTIAILQAIKSVGALQAELVLQ
ncbi:MAG: flagellar basal body P-ring protein FlgI [Brucellaceae bacterium]|uniref:flagellar basal body P-ring protein FlgI n=1 Tax=Zhengella sp. TaxID=2282762 RepID=UPI001E1A53BE|nr:flagellar basal body P-ring protein FlgI [Notoacmeibacter sp.]MCC0025471.1 flagellar basal body P-ring protein FlgI [Brucellaceae bacterium]